MMPASAVWTSPSVASAAYELSVRRALAARVQHGHERQQQRARDGVLDDHERGTGDAAQDLLAAQQQRRVRERRAEREHRAEQLAAARDREPLRGEDDDDAAERERERQQDARVEALAGHERREHRDEHGTGVAEQLGGRDVGHVERREEQHPVHGQDDALSRRPGAASRATAS